MHVLFVRHSIKNVDLEKRLGLDAPLTARGKAMARLLGQKILFGDLDYDEYRTHIITSPAYRCIQTGHEIYTGIEKDITLKDVRTDLRLKYGFLAEGHLKALKDVWTSDLTYTEWMSFNPERTRFKGSIDMGRSYKEYIIEELIPSLIKDYPTDELVILVSHDFVVGSMLEVLTNGRFRKPIPYYLSGFIYDTNTKEPIKLFQHLEVWGDINDKTIRVKKSNQ